MTNRMTNKENMCMLTVAVGVVVVVVVGGGGGGGGWCGGGGGGGGGGDGGVKCYERKLYSATT